MKKRILRILYNEKVNKDEVLETEHYIIRILQGNKEYLISRRYHYRYFKIYIDCQLNTKLYEEWINTCIKPCLPLNNDGIVFI